MLTKDGLAGAILALGGVAGAFNGEVTYLVYGFGGALLILLAGLVFARFERESQAELKRKLGIKHDYQVKLMRGTTTTLREKSTLQSSGENSWMKRWRN
jgi:cytochrome c biogenesis protein CcdA